MTERVRRENALRRTPKRERVSSESESSESDASDSESDPGSDADVLHGCSKCRYLWKGCGACSDKPAAVRPRLRWQPDGAHRQEAPEAPVYRPTEEEFRDPMAYVESLLQRPEALEAGIVRVVPPDTFEPPFALEHGTNGLSAESFRFSIRSQRTSSLFVRNVTKRRVGGGRYAAHDPARGPEHDADESSAESVSEPSESESELSEREEGSSEGDSDESDDDGSFGFISLERTHTLKSFSAYSNWLMSIHFSEPVPTCRGTEARGHRLPKGLRGTRLQSAF